MAVDLFINMGTDIKGETQDSAQKASNDIDVLAWSWGMSQSGTTHQGSGGGAGKANFQDLSFTKYIDSSSNALMAALSKGTHIAKVVLLARKAGEGQNQDNGDADQHKTEDDLGKRCGTCGNPGKAKRTGDHGHHDKKNEKFEHGLPPGGMTGSRNADAVWPVPPADSSSRPGGEHGRYRHQEPH